MSLKMIRMCSWCGEVFGEKPPLEDLSMTHGICEPCLAKWKERRFEEGGGWGMNETTFKNARVFDKVWDFNYGHGTIIPLTRQVDQKASAECRHSLSPRQQYKASPSRVVDSSAERRRVLRNRRDIPTRCSES